RAACRARGWGVPQAVRAPGPAAPPRPQHEFGLFLAVQRPGAVLGRPQVGSVPGLGGTDRSGRHLASSGDRSALAGTKELVDLVERADRAVDREEFQGALPGSGPQVTAQALVAEQPEAGLR